MWMDANKCTMHMGQIKLLRLYRFDVDNVERGDWACRDATPHILSLPHVPTKPCM